MTQMKLAAGSQFPGFTLPTLEHGDIRIGTPETPGNWQAVFVYRGKHCPICTAYLTDLKDHVSAFAAAGVEIVAVSADPEAKARAQMDMVAPNFPVAYGLPVATMQALGLYVSDPRSPQETDRPFAEPGLFVVTGDGILQIVDYANAPFLRPEIGRLAGGLKFVRENDYPVRGRHAA